jgi:hypothetical protein
LDNSRKISKPLGPPVSRPVRTTDRPRSDRADPHPSDNSRHHLAVPTALRPRPHRPPPHRPPFPPPHPPPLAAINDAHPHRGASFLLSPPFAPSVPLISATAIEPQCSAAPDPSELPVIARAPHRRVQPTRTENCRPPPPDANPAAIPLRLTTHCRGAHSSGELLPPRRPKTGSPPYCLTPRTLPATPRRGRYRNSAGPPSIGAMGASSSALVLGPTCHVGWAITSQAG